MLGSARKVLRAAPPRNALSVLPRCIPTEVSGHGVRFLVTSTRFARLATRDGTHTRSSNDMSTFADLGVSPALVSTLRARGIDAPFPIQALTVADGLAGRDLCGRAPTGSG